LTRMMPPTSLQCCLFSIDSWGPQASMTPPYPPPASPPIQPQPVPRKAVLSLDGGLSYMLRSPTCALLNNVRRAFLTRRMQLVEMLLYFAKIIGAHRRQEEQDHLLRPTTCRTSRLRLKLLLARCQRHRIEQIIGGPLDQKVLLVVH